MATVNQPLCQSVAHSKRPEVRFSEVPAWQNPEIRTIRFSGAEAFDSKNCGCLAGPVPHADETRGSGQTRHPACRIRRSIPPGCGLRNRNTKSCPVSKRSRPRKSTNARVAGRRSTVMDWGVDIGPGRAAAIRPAISTPSLHCHPQRPNGPRFVGFQLQGIRRRCHRPRCGFGSQSSLNVFPTRSQDLVMRLPGPFPGWLPDSLPDGRRVDDWLDGDHVPVAVPVDPHRRSGYNHAARCGVLFRADRPGNYSRIGPSSQFSTGPVF